MRQATQRRSVSSTRRLSTATPSSPSLPSSELWDASRLTLQIQPGRWVKEISRLTALVLIFPILVEKMSVSILIFYWFSAGWYRSVASVTLMHSGSQNFLLSVWLWESEKRERNGEGIYGLHAALQWNVILPSLLVTTCCNRMSTDCRDDFLFSYKQTPFWFC